MEKKVETKILIITIFILFIIIYSIDYKYTINPIKIREIEIKDINKKVKIIGTISKSTIINEHTFLTIKDNTSQIKAIIFYFNKSINKNKLYEIEGKITTYKQEPEIIIDKIKIKY